MDEIRFCMQSTEHTTWCWRSFRLVKTTRCCAGFRRILQREKTGRWDASTEKWSEKVTHWCVLSSLETYKEKSWTWRCNLGPYLWTQIIVFVFAKLFYILYSASASVVMSCSISLHFVCLVFYDMGESQREHRSRFSGGRKMFGVHVI